MIFHLDAGLLEDVDGLWDAVLQLVFDGCSSQQEQVLLDEFGDVVEGGSASHDLGGRFVVQARPLPVLLQRDLSTGEAERAEALGCIVLSGRARRDQQQACAYRGKGNGPPGGPS